jgi:phospholipid/cholesterol/gamma-HCH transport system substrate-binding protein
MSAPLRRGRALAVQRLGGFAFLLLLVGLIGLSIAIYQKAFTPVVTVFVEADRIGNQLSAGGDVKARGVIVGEVREVSSAGGSARIELALDPDHVETLSSDVTAQMLPKTLFGEKFVSLVPAAESSAPPLREGDVIGQDRSETARETSQALDNLLPLLQALRPQDLSVTLNALSGALRGRGDRIGENLVLVDEYLRGLNPEVATLGEDFRGLADFADTLEQAAPDVLAVLDDLSAVNRSLVDQEQELNAFLTSTTGLARESDSFLRKNEDRLIRLAADSVPVLDLYAEYSPEYACLFPGLVAQEKVAGEAFGGRQPGLHITLEIVHDQGGYRPGDEPAYGEDGPPTCRGLPPNPPERPFPAYTEVTDGYCDEAERAPGIQNGCAGRAGDDPGPAGPLAALTHRGSDRKLLGAVAGPVMGLAPDDVPDAAVLLLGPVARGTEVGLARR